MHNKGGEAILTLGTFKRKLYKGGNSNNAMSSKPFVNTNQKIFDQKSFLKWHHFAMEL